MRIAAKNNLRKETNLTVHSRAASNASSTYDDLIASNHCLSSSTISTCSNDGHSTPNEIVQQQQHHHPPPTSLTLTIPDSRVERPMAETLDLSHQRIADLTLPVVEELAEYVERLALGYNYLPVLPDHFAILGESLRYLNLRGNHMEIFPEVLTRMPSLEILDVSRNKIKAFPRRPGSLDRLRVLSVSRNRIKRLPNYVANLTTLRVLKIDHNPVIWPPKELVTFLDACDRPEEDEVDPNQRIRDDGFSHVRTRTPSNESSTSMTQWLRSLQEWMRKNPYVRPVKQTRPSTGETIGDPAEFGALRCTAEFEKSFNNFKGTHSPDISPVLTLSTGPTTSPITNSSLHTPRPNKSSDHMLQHNRNASSSSSSQWVRKRPELRLKKSLPDLRRNHAEIMVERSADVERAYFGLNRSPHNTMPPNSSSSVTFSLNSPSLADRGPRSAVTLSNGSLFTPGLVASSQPTAPSVSSRNTDLARSGGTQIRRIKIGTTGDEDSLAGDRNSGAYFRRLSMLPASTISKQVPTPLLQLMDGIRGILFSLSQIYAALKQFVMFATQDRLPGALSRMTSAADDSMGKLINSLDRFDSSTRRAQPELEVVQQVFKSCRDNVIVFGKLVNVLSIQLKVLMGSADVRYSRTLLLSLYGATAEIAMSWQMITPLVDDVVSLPSLRKSKPLPPPLPLPPPSNLHESKEESFVSSSLSSDLQRATTISASDLRQTMPREHFQTDHQAHFPESSTTKHSFDPIKTTLLNTSSGPAANNNNNMMLISPGAASSTQTKGRRHAGSFVAEDVQMHAFPISAGLANNNNLPAPSLPLPSYSSFPPSPSPSHESNASFGSAVKPEGSSSGGGVMLNDGSVTSTSRNTFNRAALDPLSLGPPSLPMLECSKSPMDSHPSVLSPGKSLPRSPALTSLSSLTANTIPFAADSPVYTNHHESSGPPDATHPPPNWAPPRSEINFRAPNINALSRSGSTTMVDIPERTTSRNHHARFDSSLSRTDQDFLDMTEATIEIALSVTSMMLENLGQATLETTSPGARPAGHHGSHNTTGIALEQQYEIHGRLESSSRRERKGTMPSSLTKAGELKELCEVEIEVIRRLRASLAAFWHARSLGLSSHYHPHQHHQLTRDGSSSASLASSASTFSSTTTTIPDPHHHHHHHHHSASTSFSSLVASSTISDSSSTPLFLGLVESKKVFDDATAFVRAVIQTANLARATMTEYPLSKAIREGLGELTKATKELATLLAVSSFKPGGPGGVGGPVGGGMGASTSSTQGSLPHSGSASSSHLGLPHHHPNPHVPPHLPQPTASSGSSSSNNVVAPSTPTFVSTTSSAFSFLNTPPPSLTPALPVTATNTALVASPEAYLSH
ncbi:hypothetical protein VP01_1634g1 [Puccinia sorghi]|uniref:RAM signaling network component n=1 Tax=Puccinia sorghi TaxID=27349 RepID=A0A0L6VIN3_9BASI|nr:hypothetical protein VP01_1634g1 [Puccinia sorghi]